MSISRRLRFEILRRDGHTCRYCGAMAPDVPLTVDHVIPTTLGGSDEPDNLVTSCQPCNAGKSSTLPDGPVVAEVASDALRWARAMEQAAQNALRAHSEQKTVHVQFDDAWFQSTANVMGKEAYRPDNWSGQIDRFLQAGLPVAVILGLVENVATNRNVFRGDKWRYLCGCCWRRITELQEDARRILESEGADGA